MSYEIKLKEKQTRLKTSLEIVKDVPVTLQVIIGRSAMTLETLLSLKKEAVVALDTLTTDPVEVHLNGQVIARGQLVIAEDHFGVKITELLS